MQSKKFLLFVHGVLPIILGGSIYILYRSTDLRIFNWINCLGMREHVDFIREFSVSSRYLIPKWLIYSLPDGLWIYSLTSTFLIIWRKNEKKVKLWLIIPLVFGILVEVLQGFNMFHGTFDILDLILLIIGFISSIILLKKKFLNEKECN
jgi:hypothetical protein